MTHCITNEPIARHGLWVGIMTRLKARNEQRRNRAAFQHVLALDPIILKDIGITRGDVVWANNLPIEVDAAQALEQTRISNQYRHKSV